MCDVWIKEKKNIWGDEEKFVTQQIRAEKLKNDEKVIGVRRSKIGVCCALLN